jgi:enterochelin esterase-like enzyme
MMIPDLKISTHTLKSAQLKRMVEYIAYVPAGIPANTPMNLLLLNDGQDADGLRLKETLAELYAGQRIGPLLLIAIKCSNERMQEYGVAGRPDYQKRGAMADLYSNFILTELLPHLHKKFNLKHKAKVGFAGFSLGGLSAFDIAWRNPQIFDVVGAFSASFWWRKKGLDDGYTPEDRIMHQVIRETPGKPELKVWLMTGTEDETEDRNHNYIIDSIDDTIDIIKELLDKGYTRPEEVFYYEMVGGRHEVPCWAIALPAFLCWAFPRTAVF